MKLFQKRTKTVGTGSIVEQAKSPVETAENTQKEDAGISKSGTVGPEVTRSTVKVLAKNWSTHSTTLVTLYSQMSCVVYVLSLVSCIWKMLHIEFEWIAVGAGLMLLLLGAINFGWNIYWLCGMKRHLERRIFSLLRTSALVAIPIILMISVGQINQPVLGIIDSCRSVSMISAFFISWEFVSNYLRYRAEPHGMTFSEWCNAPKNP